MNYLPYATALPRYSRCWRWNRLAALACATSGRGFMGIWIVSLLAIVPCSAAELLTDRQLADGWIALFDGETLYGWQPTSDANWRVEDGVIHVDEGNEGWLMTTNEFADYELHVEFKAPELTNSGVFLRTPLSPADPTQDCYELNIAPLKNPFPTGSLVGRKYWPEAKTNSNPNQPAAKSSLTPEDIASGWLEFDVVCSADKIFIRLMNTPLYEYEDSQPLRQGHIGLQFREGPVAFRNIRLKPLGLKSLFNGKDLDGWNTKLADQSQVSVTSSGELAIKNGPGQLESDAQFGNFVLQLECKVEGDGLNSGIFFRSIPGDKMNGYESQIHNGIKNGDPTQPVDAGTGAIYRRTVARRVVSADHEWFYKTIVATGPHIAVWVNGYQVTDWTDERAPDENPRRGLRTEPGTLIIQGHDPTTDLLFRNVRAGELPPR